MSFDSPQGGDALPLWSGSPHRATKDIDLLGSGPPDIVRFVDIFRAVAAADADDGVRFLPDTVAGVAIREEAIYDGIRITLEGRLGRAAGWQPAPTAAGGSTGIPGRVDHPNPSRRGCVALTDGIAPNRGTQT